jgi:hypothetical protein
MLKSISPWLVAGVALLGNVPSGLAADLPLNGIAEAAQASEEAKQASLDGGSTIGFIPLTSPTAAKTLQQYYQGFFRDDDTNPPTIEVPKKAMEVLSHLADYKAAGATHLIAICHDNENEEEYVRLILIGNFKPAAYDRLEASGLGHRGEDNSFIITSFKDGKEISSDAKLPPLPIARLTQMAGRLASESDCAVDIIPLARKDAVQAYEDALKEAFAEDGQPPQMAVVPARARQLEQAFPTLKSFGATHIIVTSFQNLKGSDIVLVVANGSFTADAQAEAKKLYALKNASETTLVIGRWVDGDDSLVPAATPTTPKATIPERRPFIKR